MFDLDPVEMEALGRRLDGLGLERTANHVIAPEHNPMSPDPMVRQRAYEHMQSIVDCCARLGTSILAGARGVPGTGQIGWID